MRNVPNLPHGDFYYITRYLSTRKKITSAPTTVFSLLGFERVRGTSGEEESRRFLGKHFYAITGIRAWILSKRLQLQEITRAPSLSPVTAALSPVHSFSRALESEKLRPSAIRPEFSSRCSQRAAISGVNGNVYVNKRTNVIDIRRR